MTQYHLWLTPNGDSRNRLANLINTLSDQNRGPRFEPHITLLGEIEGEESLLSEQVRMLATKLRPFSIDLQHPNEDIGVRREEVLTSGARVRTGVYEELPVWLENALYFKSLVSDNEITSPVQPRAQFVFSDGLPKVAQRDDLGDDGRNIALRSVTCSQEPCN